MIRLLLLATLFALLPPWLHQAAPIDPAENRLPIALVAAPSSVAATQASFDAAAASGHVVRGAAALLRARGFSVFGEENEGLVVAPYSKHVVGPTGQGLSGQAGAPSGRMLTLSVTFPEAAARLASGTETRFGGRGDEAWRLAVRVQSHLMSGLSDVMGYRSYDRGVVEHGESGPPSAGAVGPQDGDSWVVAYPLFATNPTERAMLESPGTLDLLSLALADAVADYLNRDVPTPARDPRYGWRRSTPWQPVAPRLVLEAERSTRVALTFDAASYPPLRPAILETLRDEGVRCTMFLTGDFVDRYPEVVVQMVRDGHEIANHSDTHPDMPSISSEAIVSDLEGLETKVVALTGRSTRPWFRPPSGAYNDRVVQVAAEQGYYTIYWTGDSADWRPDVDAASVRERFLRYARPGAILVAHLTSPQTAEVLPEVLRVLKGRGVEFGTVSEVLGTM